MLQTTVFSAEGRLNTKLPRHKECLRHFESQNDIDDEDPESIKPTYTTKSTKEELCIEYVKSFLDQFQAIYMQDLKKNNKKLKTPIVQAQAKPRKLPYMLASNEYGVEKFVCSTLRPTLMPIPELYDMYECASFIAGFINYEPLEPQTEPPKYLFSPTLTMKSNVGDSFDIANLLCSFLLGSGYDAYVVNGYAPKFITLRDQSRTVCPLIQQHDSNQFNKVDGKVAAALSAIMKIDANEQEKLDDSPYVPPDNSVKPSRFLADEAERVRLASLDKFQLWLPEAEPDDERKMSESEVERDREGGSTGIPIKRVHAWVLVYAGKRDVRESVFVEPSTGRVYTLTASPYVGIESVWNNENYWINLHVDKPVSEIDFDLKSEPRWEQLFLSSPHANAKGRQKGNEADEQDLMNQSNAPETESKAADESISRYFDAPPSWVEPLSITRSRYLLKYPPHGKRSIQYYCAKADMFSRRINSQSMVMRIVLYLDKECTIVKEIHEWFENRVDKMFKRIRYFLENRRFVEFYSAGSFGEVKKRTEFPGKRIELDFYVDGRLDRLLRREEVIGESITEYFQDRTDYLVYRSVELTTDKNVAGARQFVLPGGTLAAELFITKMTQSFDHDPAAVSGTDIAKREFFVREGKAVFFFHFGKSQITGKIKTYLHTRGPLIPVISELALTQEVGLDDDPDALMEAAALERECYTSVKASFSQNDKIQENRREVERDIVIDKSVFDRALDAVESKSLYANGGADKNAGDENKGATDYLTAFLRGPAGDKLLAGGSLTKEEALEIRQACLDALKARLVERANIIQTRLHEENAKLARKQEQFQRSQREGDLSTEEYEKYCTEAMFRIQILEQRLAAHEEAAVRKFADLDLKLSGDFRLKVLKA